MSEKKYGDISISEITERAGVNRSTYYRNFSSKEEIVRFYIEQIMNGYLEEYETLNDKSFEGYLNILFEHFYSYKSSLLTIYHNDLSYLILEVLNSIFAKRQSQKLRNQKEQFRMFYHMGGIYNFFILWFSHGMEETPEELTKISVEMFHGHAKPVLLDFSN